MIIINNKIDIGPNTLQIIKEQKIKNSPVPRTLKDPLNMDKRNIVNTIIET